jgi:hypothetical protein
MLDADPSGIDRSIGASKAPLGRCSHDGGRYHFLLVQVLRPKPVHLKFSHLRLFCIGVCVA